MKMKSLDLDKKRISTSSGWLTLWIEFEIWEPHSFDPADEFFNMIIHVEDGRSCGLNVWTYSYLENTRTKMSSSGENLSGLYLIPPDLFVEKAERELLEKVTVKMFESGELEEHLSALTLGFCVKFGGKNLTNDIFTSFIEAIDELGLSFNGVQDKDGIWKGYVGHKYSSGSLEEQHRLHVETWFINCEWVTTHFVGEIEEDYDLDDAFDDGDG